MAEYTTDELAEGSDDEKRRSRRQRSVAKSVVVVCRVWGRGRVGPTASPAPLAAPAAALQFHPSPTARRPGAATTPGQRAVGPCFACVDMGHLRLHCPKITAALDSGRRWYPFHKGDSSDNDCGVVVNRPDKECGVVCVGDIWEDAADMAPTGEVFVDNVVAPAEVARQWEVEDGGSKCQPTSCQPISVKGRLRDRHN